MRVGTIGSGAIVDRMIESMQVTEHIEVIAVYSRTMDRAQEFAQKHHVKKWYDSLEQMLADDEIDTIYIASPNSLHFEQSKKAILAHKHVICEKPFTATRQECDALFDLAKENGVLIFEAITTMHVPNYHIVKEKLPMVGDLKMIQCNFSQFSSRYDKYKNREHTNVFDPAYQGGALMDINVYCIHFVTGILGKPDSVQYIANQGYNGIDTSGVLIMKYPNVLAVCMGAKDSSSENHVYLQGDKGTIRVYGSSCGVCQHVEWWAPKQDMIGKKDTAQATPLGIDQKYHMRYECEEFERILAEQDMQAYARNQAQTKLVVSILEEARSQM